MPATNKNDVRLTVFSTAVCRTPVFGLNDELETSWPALKELIREASPAFYEVIKHHNISGLDEKAAYTVWKYFNRARFRATPFGSFAAVSFVPVQAGGAQLRLRQGMIKRHFTNWSEKDEVIAHAPPGLFMANATCYIVAHEVRYLRYLNGQFELTSIADFPELQAILTASKHPVTASEILELLTARFKLATASARALLRQLTEAQLLLTDHYPNITGTDYFERLHYHMQPKAANYIIAARIVKEGAMDKNTLHGIPAYLHFMNAFLPLPQHHDLNSFKTAFQRKFDRKAIPLVLAMDPHTGIGYGNTAQNPTDEIQGALLESLQQRRQDEHQISYNAQYRFLLNALLSGEPIRLESYTESLPGSLPALPNTLSVMLHKYHEQLVIGQVGGCTANALLGRFTLGSAQATSVGKEIAAAEEKANPGVLFFDVAYQAEKQVDNVNRRASLYQAELPLLSWSCHPTPLTVDDILVAVRDNQIVLWSKTYQRRIVPRIASAYNYTRSDLALFRFLCDLQHQGLRSDLSFRLQQFFPGLTHYPRVYYKNFIVSPASWLADKAQIKNLMSVREWLGLKKINFPFHCGNSDQTLLINPEKEEDLEAFISYLGQNKEVYITEALLDMESVTDDTGKAYAAQYIATFGHHQQVYPECPRLEETVANNAFLPGGEWLYVEIHGHVTQANYLLTAIIRPFLAHNKNHFKHWFFIRYADGGPHIRLRFKLHSPAAGAFLLNELNARLKPLYHQGRLWDMQVRTYIPEKERYGSGRIALAERFFARDSAYVLRLLSSGDKTGRLYNKLLQLMDRLCIIAFPDLAPRLGFIQSAANAFAREFNFDGDDYKKINRSFENLEEEATPLKLSKGYQEAFRCLMDSCPDDRQKTSLLGDLLHMHINRVFYADQRLHEAIIYQYLLKRVKMGRYVKPVTASELLPTH